MTDLPDGLAPERHLDLRGRERHTWIRRALLALLFLVVLLALFNRFGQRPEVATSAAPRAELELYAPDTVRGGLLFEARITIRARQEVKDARLVLDNGWTEGLTINTIEPSPLGEASADGRLSLDLGHVPAGQKYVLWMQFQVNPTNLTRRPANIDLYDGDARLLTHRHELTVLP